MGTEYPQDDHRRDPSRLEETPPTWQTVFNVVVGLTESPQKAESFSRSWARVCLNVLPELLNQDEKGSAPWFGTGPPDEAGK